MRLRPVHALTIALSSLLGSCGPEIEQGQPQENPQSAAPGTNESVKEMRAAYIASVQQNAGESYAADVADGIISLDNDVHQFVATVDRQGVIVASKREPWHLALRTVSVGCNGAPMSVSDATADAAGNRVRYAREGLEEWYLNGPLGLEQGYVLRDVPACSGFKTITVAVDGDVPIRLDDPDGDGRGESARFFNDDGRHVLEYGELFVKDASGKTLPAWISVDAGELSIVVDDAGAKYPITIDPLIVTEQAKLVASDGGPQDLLGNSVSIDGDTAVAGAFWSDAKGVDSGAAYVYRRNGGVWALEAKLMGSDTTAGDWLGHGAAISGDTIVVGASRDDDKAIDSGSAYVFVRNGGVWAQQAKLVPSDGTKDDHAGGAVAISGDTIIVGASYDDEQGSISGSAYVFVRNGTTWTQQAKLTSGEWGSGDEFGWTVALDGDTALIAAPWGGPVDQGAGYVFVRNGTTWTKQAKLLPSDGVNGDAFGCGAAVLGDTIMIGSFWANVGSSIDQGATYVYKRNGTSWPQETKLVGTGADSYEHFGYTIGLSGDLALIGAATASPKGWESGVAYLFQLNGGVWTQLSRFTGGDITAGDQFGSFVSLSGNSAIISAYRDTINGNYRQGSLYMFDFPDTLGPPSGAGAVCAIGTQCTTGFCVDGFCCDSPCTDTCMACSASKKGSGANGVCGSIAYDTDPDNECYGGSCDGKNVCKLYNGVPCTMATECLSNYCVDGVCCGNICMGECVACSMLKKGGGYNGVCGYVAANTNPSGECNSGGVCNGSGTCSMPQTKAANGAACSSAAQCQSGYCADGVCCDSWCLGICQACTAAKKGGGVDGVCGPLAKDTDPENECFGGSCNGQGACKRINGSVCSMAAQCSSGYCVDSVCCDSACNDGCQACSAAKKGSGQNGVCTPIDSGKDPDNECAPGECNGSGACNQTQTPLANGSACISAMQCASGFCVDGRCCDSACTGECQACSNAKKGNGGDGVCGSIKYDTDPDEECWGGACSGQGACKFYNGVPCTTTTECLSNYCVDGFCCGNICTGACSACSAAKKGSGFNGVCGFITSGTDPDDECPAAASCTGLGSCVAPLSSPCSSSVECASGFCSDGICCDNACSDTCVACTAIKKGSGNDGACGLIAAGTDPDNECPKGSCNASGACANEVFPCAELVTSPLSGVAIEGAQNATYTLVLDAQPCGDVTVTLTGDAQINVSPMAITFTTSDWNQPRTITAEPVVDSVIEGPHSGTITHAVLNGESFAKNISIQDFGRLSHVSIALAGAGADGASSRAVVSDDGRYVAFLSAAKNLVADDSNTFTEVFLRDIDTGTTSCVSRGAAPSANGNAYQVVISANGDKVGFFSMATNIVGPPLVTGDGDAYVYTRTTGSTIRVSPLCSGACNSEFADWIGMSKDGEHLAFTTRRPLLESTNDGEFDVFRVGVASGVMMQASLNSSGQNGNYYWGSNAFDPNLSPTGRYVGFRSAASNFGAPELTVPNFHSYVKDMDTGLLTRVSRHSGGDSNCDTSSYTQGTSAPFISADGNLAVFHSTCVMTVESGPADTNAKADVFIRNIANKTTRRSSVSTLGAQANGDSGVLGISDDARYVLFWSDATNLVPDDTNGARDVFLHDTSTAVTVRVGLDANKQQIPTGVITAQMSRDGRYVVISTTSNLLPTDTNVNIADVYLIELR